MTFDVFKAALEERGIRIDDVMKDQLDAYAAYLRGSERV